MMKTIASVIRAEGLHSAIRRTNERIEDTLRGATARLRGVRAGTSDAAILNVVASGKALRLGGVQTQLASRLRDERGLRSVALLSPGLLEVTGSRRVAVDLETGIREAIGLTGARAVHFEGMHDVPLSVVLRLAESGIRVIVSVHDFSLFCARPHLIEEPVGRFCNYSHDLERCHRCLRQTWDVPLDAQHQRRMLGRQILTEAMGLIFPSGFLLDQHRQLFSLPDLLAEVVEPGVPAPKLRDRGARHAIAYAGSVKRHKGAHLLPELARLLGDVDIHVFGGGDEDLFRAMRQEPNIIVHGYYRAGTLPALLARNGIGLVLIPSIWPETHSIVLSEAWLAGAAVAAFDLGAPAERIHHHGGGWLAPLDRGAAGLAKIVDDWMAGRITTRIPTAISSPPDAARAHVDLYRKWGVL